MANTSSFPDSPSLTFIGLAECRIRMFSRRFQEDVLVEGYSNVIAPALDAHDYAKRVKRFYGSLDIQCLALEDVEPWDARFVVESPGADLVSARQHSEVFNTVVPDRFWSVSNPEEHDRDLVLRSHEEGFAGRFLRTDFAPRYLENGFSRSNVKRRKAICRAVTTGIDQDKTALLEVPKTREETVEMLIRKGAGSLVYAISEGSHDGEFLALWDAMDFSYGSLLATVLICVPGKLAYIETGVIGNRFIAETSGGNG